MHQFSLPTLRFIHVKGAVRNLGGQATVVQAALQRCLQRMACLAKVAIKTVATEFPAFELITCFACFSLPKRERGLAPRDMEEHVTHLRRLALAWALDVDALQRQFLMLRPYACKEFSARSCTNMEAWQEATQQQCARGIHHTATSDPVDDVVLAPHTCAGGTRPCPLDALVLKDVVLNST